MSVFKNISALVISACSIFTSVYATEMYWPEVEYDTSIPRHVDVFDYAAGEKITTHADMLKYFDALLKAAPDNIKKVSYAHSWEGRELVYLVIGTAENIAKLDEFETNIQKLADPRTTTKAEANALIDSLPAAVWLGYGVHGNEISSTDAAMMTAYHLLASQNNPMTQQIMNNALVFIDPLQNPDGRERFTSRYYATVGLEASGDRFSAEHNEPWPQGRSNHYLFDMNRDWLAMTQPETQGRIFAMNRYLPLVVIDLHEMGGDNSYYFAPAAEPLNPLMTADQTANMGLIGQNHAKHFDAMGYDYFTREVYDAFYPGYGDSWPTFYGASASTYEVGSARGEVFIKRNGERYTYADSVQKHFIASVSTIEATAKYRNKLLTDFRQYQISAIAAGEKSTAFVIPMQADRAGAHKLAQLLDAHGIEVQQTKQDLSSCGQTFKAGSFVVDPAQPKGRLVEAVLREQVNMDANFIKRQEQRRSRNLDDQIYDLTAWSLPLMFNLDVIRCGSIKASAVMPFDTSQELAAQLSNPTPKVAYLLPWGDMAAGRFLTQALRLGLNIKSSDLAFTLDNTDYPAGSLIIEVKQNSTELTQQIQKLADDTGAIVNGVDSSWVTDGPNFGSNNVVQMHAPKIAMAWDDPTSSLSAGNSRFVIERQLGYPVTAIRSKHLNIANLNNYDVLVLPAGDYQQTFNQTGIKNITTWVKRGGVLITFGAATDYALREKVGWLAVKKELAHKADLTAQDSTITAAEKATDKNTAEGQLIENKDELMQAIQADSTLPDAVSGVLTRVAVDQDHWLTAGVKPEVIGLVTGNHIMTPIKLDKGKNVAWFKGPDELLASGYLWQENRQQLAYKPFLIHQPTGQGMVIAYTQEPTTRAFLDGLHVMLTNTLFRSVAHSGQLR
jgi:hypothetical protein